MGNLCSPNDSMAISDISDIRNYIDNYIDSNLQKKSDRIFQHLTHYRKIKGDGNCFYRSISYLFLETILLEKDISLLNSVIIEINNDTVPLLLCDSSPLYSLSSFLLDSDRLKNAISNPLCSLLSFLQQDKKLDEDNHIYVNSSTLQTNSNKQERLNMNEEVKDNYKLAYEKGGIGRRLLKLFNEDFFFDLGMIVYVRSKIYSFFKEKEKMKFYEPFIDDFEGLQKKIRIFDKEAESSIIALAAEVFNINLEIYILHIITKKRRKQKVDVFVERHEPKFGNNHARRSLKLIFRPGHYDIGYNF